LFERYGFARAEDQHGKGSGGEFASITLARNDRAIRLWLRGESLSVTYRLADDELDHHAFMRELLGPAGGNKFPAYADDAQLAFGALGYDLEHFCQDFLAGTGDEFRRCVAAAQHSEGLTGAQRLARIEQQLKRD
jgi:hypothetical protein